MAWPMCRYPLGSGGNLVMTLPPVAFKCSASFSLLLLRCHCPRSSLKLTVVRTCIALTACDNGSCQCTPYHKQTQTHGAQPLSSTPCGCPGGLGGRRRGLLLGQMSRHLPQVQALRWLLAAPLQAKPLHWRQQLQASSPAWHIVGHHLLHQCCGC